MKKADWILILCVAVVAALFAIPQTHCAEGFNWATAHHPYIMAFFKFAILATLGEMLALRIREGVYNKKGFGVLPRMMVWGFLGMCIAIAMVIFKNGTPYFLASIGIADYTTIHNAFFPEFPGGPEPPFSLAKLGVAFAVSVLMNSIFAPVMMTFHKCTDIHITDNGGTVRGLLRPMKMRDIFAHKVNWDMQWNFVIKKTIPLFWFPAHTITFILPANLQVLFAALLGVALGLILAIKK